MPVFICIRLAKASQPRRGAGGEEKSRGALRFPSESADLPRGEGAAGAGKARGLPAVQRGSNLAQLGFLVGGCQGDHPTSPTFYSHPGRAEMRGGGAPASTLGLGWCKCKAAKPESFSKEPRFVSKTPLRFVGSPGISQWGEGRGERGLK